MTDNDNAKNISAADAMLMMAADIRKLVSLEENMARPENMRSQAWRWRLGGAGVQSFRADIPVKYWSFFARTMSGGPGFATLFPGSDAPEMDIADQLFPLGYGGGLLVASRWTTIPSNERLYSIRSLLTTTAIDVLVVAHNGGWGIL